STLSRVECHNLFGQQHDRSSGRSGCESEISSRHRTFYRVNFLSLTIPLPVEIVFLPTVHAFSVAIIEFNSPRLVSPSRSVYEICGVTQLWLGLEVIVPDQKLYIHQ